MEIGYRYNSAGVVLEPGPHPPHEHPRDAKGRPGSRAPHVFLGRDGSRVSTLDLFGGNFVLLAGPDGAAWREAALTAAGSLGITLEAYVAGGPGLSDPDGCFPAAYGISPSGAVLVRPDGFTGWRAASLADDPERLLQAALRSLLGRDDGTP
jgi:putative polyketide hydroxylase